jgi:hypothetical protein
MWDTRYCDNACVRVCVCVCACVCVRVIHTMNNKVTSPTHAEATYE